MNVNPFELLEHRVVGSTLMSLTNPKNYKIEEDVNLPSDISDISEISGLKQVPSLVFPDTVKRVVRYEAKYGRHGGFSRLEKGHGPVFSNCDFSQITVYDSLEFFGGCFLNKLYNHGISDYGDVSRRELCRLLGEINQLEEKDRFLNQVFQDCPNFRKLIIRHAENSDGIIQPTLFKGVHELKKVEIQDGVRTIGDDAFAYCLNLEKIVIPPSVTAIRYDAFHFDTKLEIYGETGSYAQEYARIFGFPFYDMSKEKYIDEGNKAG